MSPSALLIGEALIDEVVESDRVTDSGAGADLPSLRDLHAGRVSV